MARPGTWHRVQTDAGWHLRLVGANGEPVLTSEVYTDKDTATDAWLIAGRSFEPLHGEGAHLVDVDERGKA